MASNKISTITQVGSTVGLAAGVAAGSVGGLYALGSSAGVTGFTGAVAAGFNTVISTIGASFIGTAATAIGLTATVGAYIAIGVACLAAFACCALLGKGIAKIIGKNGKKKKKKNKSKGDSSIEKSEQTKENTQTKDNVKPQKQQVSSAQDIVNDNYNNQSQTL